MTRAGLLQIRSDSLNIQWEPEVDNRVVGASPSDREEAAQS